MKNGFKVRLESHGKSDLRQTLETLPHLLDEHTGLIKKIEWYTQRYNEPQFIHCHATMPDLTRITGRVCSHGTGGTALAEDAALAKAIGESVERYCGDFWNNDQIVHASYTSVKDQAIDPERFVLFHPEQYQAPDFPFQRITKDSRIAWARGFSLTHNRPALVPAALVHLGHQPENGEPYFESGPVSGYACGNTVEEALLGAICEVVERDAFMVFWYNQLPDDDLKAIYAYLKTIKPIRNAVRAGLTPPAAKK